MAETVLTKRRKELKERFRKKTLQRLKEAAILLYNEGAEEVYVIGSILKASEFNEHSDADIAVKGISEDKRPAVISRLEVIFKGIPFDILFLEEDLRPEIREKIKKEGILWKH
jgi:predicted nucleotidyltransferase